jgi:hypothetical protein
MLSLTSLNVTLYLNGLFCLPSEIQQEDKRKRKLEFVNGCECRILTSTEAKRLKPCLDWQMHPWFLKLCWKITILNWNKWVISGCKDFLNFSTFWILLNSLPRVKYCENLFRGSWVVTRGQTDMSKPRRTLISRQKAWYVNFECHYAELLPVSKSISENLLRAAASLNSTGVAAVQKERKGRPRV